MLVVNVHLSLTSCGLLLGSPKTLRRFHAHRAQIHACVQSLMCFAHGSYEALLGLLNHIDKFTISLESN